MSTSRIFRAFMSLLAVAAVFAAATSTATALTTGPTGPTAATGPVGETVVEPALHRGPVVLKIDNYKANFGGKFRLRGRTGISKPGKLRIQSNASGSWRTLRQVKTDAQGHFALKVRARKNTSLRAITSDGRSSKVRRVTVIGQVKLDRGERYVRLGDRLSIRGTVLPRGVRTVKVRVRGQGVVTTRSRVNGRFAVRWSPRSAGDFSYRVWAKRSRKSTGDASLRRKFSALRPGHASYYGPGLYGNGVACGGTLTPSTRGVAHKYLPCGTRVTLQYGNRTVVARVIDRGPYIAGRDWDLTEQTRNDLGFGGVGVVWTNR